MKAVTRSTAFTRIRCIMMCMIVTLPAVNSMGQSQRAPTSSAAYRFDGTISRRVLENYLDRSVTMAYFLVTGRLEGNRDYRYRNDDVRLIENIGAKFIGRAIYRWNGESLLNDPNFWTNARALIDRVHAFDPDVIFQGCLFETISRDVNRVRIPACPIGYGQEVRPDEPGATAEETSQSESEVGARAIVQVGYRFLPGLVVAVRGSYQGRTIYHAGPGVGGAVRYTW